MIKKFIALSLAVLVMASHMVSAYAYDLLPDITIHDNTDQWTENGVTGKLYSYQNNPYYQTFYASTSAPGETQAYGYIYVSILLEIVEDDTIITDKCVDGHYVHSAKTTATVTYDRASYVRVTSIHKAGSSENNLSAAFGLRKIYAM